MAALISSGVTASNKTPFCTCAHTQRHKHSIFCLVTRWAVPVLLPPPSRDAHSRHRVVPCLYHRTQTASRSTQHFLSMLSPCWSSCCILLQCPKVTSWDCPTPVQEHLVSLSGFHQEVLQVLALQQGPSFLWLCLFQGFIAIWDWFPVLDCLYPIIRGPDC